MRSVLFCFACASLLFGCADPGRLPRHPVMPIRTVDEVTNEWLHDHCDVRQVVRLQAGEVEPRAVAAASNFVEVLYKDPDGYGVVMYACKKAPVMTVLVAGDDG